MLSAGSRYWYIQSSPVRGPVGSRGTAVQQDLGAGREAWVLATGYPANASRVLMEPEVSEMLRINKAQAEYYDHADGADESEVNGLATNLWRRWRGRALSVFEEAAMDGSLSQVHLRWLPQDLSQFKVLDLGVGYGNPLSITLARAARSYTAIDLSPRLVEHFQRQLDRAGLGSARAIVADFLSEDFAERDFDLVYARAVFHHFKYFDAFLEKLHGHLA